MANAQLPLWRLGNIPHAYYFAAADRVEATRLSHKALRYYAQPEEFTRVPGLYAAGRPRQVKL
jgi:hypothetical protein